MLRAAAGSIRPPVNLTSPAPQLPPLSFAACRLLLVDFKEFCANPEATVRKVIDFVGADNSR
jgi:hypothetical protein